jgi:micrococcal nuclease
LDASVRRRFRRPPYRTLVILLVLAALVLYRVFIAEPVAPSPAQPLAAGTYAVERVVDGDTIIIEPDTRVRLIGVDTPETVQPDHPEEPYGAEAARFTRAFLAGGRARLSFDRERFDRYGRHLAYVWVGERMLNEALVREGLARFEPQFDYQEPIKRRFREAQKEAQAAKLGIWSADGGPR